MRFKPIPWIPQTQQDRFWDRIDRDGPNGCWLWTGSISGNGYGLYYIAFGDERRLQIGTHRLAYHLTYGEIPPGQVVRHTCDVKLCCRPDHLVPGTQRENIRDMVLRKRQRWQEYAPSKTGPWQDDAPGRVFGERHGMARLKEGDVVEIRSRYATGTVTLKLLAKEFGMSAPSIGSIVRYRSWKHLDGPDLGKGFRARGERIHCSNLTVDQVQEIRRLHATTTMNRADLARQFGVGWNTIDAIVKHKTWSHVD